MDRPRVIGRYALYDQLGAGGMGSVCIGVQRDGGVAGPVIVAVKELHAVHARDPKHIVMLLDEMRLTRLAQHPNVVTVRDSVYDGDRMILVMDYIHGESLRRLFRASQRDGKLVALPLRIAAAVVCDVLHALDAAHHARDEKDEVVGLVHRDVTPENILVDEMGVVKLADFGVAKAEGRLLASTQGAGIKGKLAYLAPEQVGGEVSARTDIYAAALVLWEAIAAHRAIIADSEAQTLVLVLTPTIPRVREVASYDVPVALEEAIARALHPSPAERFARADDFARAIEDACGEGGIATREERAAWVAELIGEQLRTRQRRLDEILSLERGDTSGPPATPTSTAAFTVPASSGSRFRRSMLGVVVLVIAAMLVAIGGLMALATKRVEPTAIRAMPSSIALPVQAPPLPPPSDIPSAAVSSASSSSTATRTKKRVALPPHDNRPGCDPPFVVDSSGIMVFKKECLK